MEKFLTYIARANYLLALASAASTTEERVEYLNLAALWINFASAHRKMLSESGLDQFH